MIEENTLIEADKQENPLDAVIKTILKSQAKSCVLADKKLKEIEKNEK